eukprot:359474-Chlamydomonas_euryale.AAC.1
MTDRACARMYDREKDGSEEAGEKGSSGVAALTGHAEQLSRVQRAVPGQHHAVGSIGQAALQDQHHAVGNVGQAALQDQHHAVGSIGQAALQDQHHA